MTVIKIRLAVPDEFVDPASDTGITEKGYLSLANGLDIGQIVDITPDNLPSHTGEPHADSTSTSE